MTESRRTANGFRGRFRDPIAGTPPDRPGRPRSLVDRVGANRFVCLGEASHGTHEYYRWRAELSRCLIEEHGFRWIGVESDWPDCWRINRWVRGQDDQDLDAYGILGHFERWPTWMWANEEGRRLPGLAS